MPLDQRQKDLLKIGDSLFSKKLSLDTLRQEIANLYYFERADFTTKSALGRDYAAGSITSYPHFARRELGGLLPSILRTGQWFDIHVGDEKLDEKHDVRTWLEWATRTQHRAMRDPDSVFTATMDEGDEDIITFGDVVISIEIDIANTSLLYRNWHLRDCVWLENQRRKTDAIWRKWNPTCRLLRQKFGDANVHPDVVRKCKETPEAEVNCRHIVVTREDYDYRSDRNSKMPFMSLYVDVENQFIMEETPEPFFKYVVSHWGRISETQYGYSPAVVMPDARSANVVRAVLLDAGELAINPPLIATKEAIRSDLGIYAGGVTWVDIEYDERLGEALRPLNRDTRGLPFGMELETAFKDMLANSFFLNKLILPPDIGKMTAYEAQKRIQEHVRSSTALFEPLDDGYSSPICEATFDALMSVGTFGARDPKTGALLNAPQELGGRQLEYEFTNPIRETEKEMQAQRFVQGLQIANAVAGVDQIQIEQINMDVSFRAALKGLGWPAEWLEDETAFEQSKIAFQQRQKLQAGAAALGTGATVAKTGAEAARALSQAGISLGS